VPLGGQIELLAFAQSCTPSDNGFRVEEGVSWESSHPTIASVSSAGIVTGNAVGTATITATFRGVTGARGVSVEAQNHMD
jgi:uncharacterized protein YjdB